MILAGRHEIDVSRVGDRHTLYALGDLHMGNSGCHLEKLRADVARIAADPHALVIGMGDYADYIGPSDKRWEPACVTPDIPISALQNWGQYLAEAVVRELRPLRGKIIGMLEGNHEHVYEARQAQALHGWVCTELGARNLGYSCFIDLSFRKSMARRSGTAARPTRRYRIFAHHGAGAAVSAGGKINRLIRFMHSNDADIFLVGHLHEKDPKRIDCLAANDSCTELVEKRKLGLFTGTYLKTYGAGSKAGYGERAGYSPVPLGCSMVEFQPFSSDWCHRRDSVTARVVV